MKLRLIYTFGIDPRAFLSTQGLVSTTTGAEPASNPSYLFVVVALFAYCSLKSI